MTNSRALIAAAAAVLIGAATPAWAVEGCKVLLCLAGSWQSIPACVSEVEQLFQDLLIGEPFPSCSLASGAAYTPAVPNAPVAGAAAANMWLAQRASAPDPNCPPPYVTTFYAAGRTMYGCAYVGMIPLHVNGGLWSTTYWNMGGGSVTELSAYAHVAGALGVKRISDLQTYEATRAAAATTQASGPGGREVAK
jgi:hypothetical protein